MVEKRSVQKRHTQEDALETRAKNRIYKDKERARRDARMMAIVRDGSPPYSPAVMSWLSRKLGKNAGRITSDDIATLLS